MKKSFELHALEVNYEEYTGKSLVVDELDLRNLTNIIFLFIFAFLILLIGTQAVPSGETSAISSYKVPEFGKVGFFDLEYIMTDIISFHRAFRIDVRFFSSNESTVSLSMGLHISVNDSKVGTVDRFKIPKTEYHVLDENSIKQNNGWKSLLTNEYLLHNKIQITAIFENGIPAEFIQFKIHYVPISLVVYDCWCRVVFCIASIILCFNAVSLRFKNISKIGIDSFILVVINTLYTNPVDIYHYTYTSYAFFIIESVLASLNFSYICYFLCRIPCLLFDINSLLPLYNAVLVFVLKISKNTFMTSKSLVVPTYCVDDGFISSSVNEIIAISTVLTFVCLSLKSVYFYKTTMYHRFKVYFAIFCATLLPNICMNAFVNIYIFNKYSILFHYVSSTFFGMLMFYVNSYIPNRDSSRYTNTGPYSKDPNSILQGNNSCLDDTL